MDSLYHLAMEALGRPRKTPRAVPGPLRARTDLPVVLLALSIGVLVGFALGKQMIGFSYVVIALPLVIPVATAMLMRRSVGAAVLGGVMGVMLSAGIALFLIITGIYDSLW